MYRAGDILGACKKELTRKAGAVQTAMGAAAASRLKGEGRGRTRATTTKGLPPAEDYLEEDEEGEEDDVPVHKITVKPDEKDPNAILPTSYRMEGLKGGFDYVFKIRAFNAFGKSDFVQSKKISPTSVVMAKNKDDLPQIFSRFGIDMSQADNVKQALDELWSRYERNEFYLEVNQKKQVRERVLRDVHVHSR